MINLKKPKKLIIKIAELKIRNKKLTKLKINKSSLILNNKKIQLLGVK
jgi:hypothetical protein